MICSKKFSVILIGLFLALSQAFCQSSESNTSSQKEEKIYHLTEKEMNDLKMYEEKQKESIEMLAEQSKKQIEHIKWQSNVIKKQDESLKKATEALTKQKELVERCVNISTHYERNLRSLKITVGITSGIAVGAIIYACTK